MRMSGISVASRLHQVKQRIETACLRAGRSLSDVNLLAVSKLHSPELILQAAEWGQFDFAENYVQEVVFKQEQIADPRVRWHFIGRIQSNKVKMLQNRFSIIHSVDRFSIAHHLDKLSAPKVQDIFIQFNVAQEISKAGVSELELENLVRGVSACANLRILGLMVMPPPSDVAEDSRTHFREARATLQRLRQTLTNELARHPFNQLSMGTSHDFEVAIEEGANWVRIGTDIFGARNATDLKQEFQ